MSTTMPPAAPIPPTNDPLVKVLGAFLAYDAQSKRNRMWVTRVRTLADGVTVQIDLSGWADA
jgi:hypothetical protein